MSLIITIRILQRNLRKFSKRLFKVQKLWSWRDSNPQSPASETGALSFRPHDLLYSQEEPCNHLDERLAVLLAMWRLTVSWQSTFYVDNRRQATPSNQPGRNIVIVFVCLFVLICSSSQLCRCTGAHNSGVCRNVRKCRLQRHQKVPLYEKSIAIHFQVSV